MTVHAAPRNISLGSDVARKGGRMHKSDTVDEREQVARAALAAQYGRPLTDEEWSMAQAQLIRYVCLLRDWDRRATAGVTVPPA
jgi:hypothetical protein